MEFDHPKERDDDQSDSPRQPEGRKSGDADAVPPEAPDLPDRATYWAEYRKAVEVEYRAYAIEQGCDRVRETEDTVVTPAMRRIEGEDPDRHLVGLEFRLKGRERIEEKVTFDVQKKGISASEAFDNIKDAIRYTFEYRDDKYTDGVHADVNRLTVAGFELVDLRNSWPNKEYKGINSRWRAPENGQLFEVQFHTEASFRAKQETHAAYEKLRDPATSKAEQRELQQYQREVSTRTPVPPKATDIENYP